MLCGWSLCTGGFSFLLSWVQKLLAPWKTIASLLTSEVYFYRWTPFALVKYGRKRELDICNTSSLASRIYFKPLRCHLLLAEEQQELESQGVDECLVPRPPPGQFLDEAKWIELAGLAFRLLKKCNLQAPCLQNIKGTVQKRNKDSWVPERSPLQEACHQLKPLEELCGRSPGNCWLIAEVSLSGFWRKASKHHQPKSLIVLSQLLASLWLSLHRYLWKWPPPITFLVAKWVCTCLFS